MYEIIPSPGTEDKEWSAIEKKIEQVKSVAKTIHIDVIDGKFANNTTFSDPEPFKKYSGSLAFEVHLMVEEPINHIRAWANAGFTRFIGHIEKMSDQAAFIAEAEKYGYAGLAVDGSTSIDALTVSPLDLDTVLIMTIQAGFSGQEFKKEYLEKVKALIKTTEFFPVSVDGGVNEQTVVDAWHAGAKRFVMTSALYGTEDPAEALQHLQHTLHSLQRNP